MTYMISTNKKSVQQKTFSNNTYTELELFYYKLLINMCLSYILEKSRDDLVNLIVPIDQNIY